MARSLSEADLQAPALLAEIRGLRAELAAMRGLLAAIADGAQRKGRPGNALARFLATWHALHGARVFRAADAVRLAMERTARGEQLRNALESAVELDARAPANSLGCLLKRAIGVRTGGDLQLEVVPSGGRRRGRVYRVVQVRDSCESSASHPHPAHDPFNFKGQRR